MNAQSRRNFLRGLLGLCGLALLPAIRPPKPIDPNPPIQPVDPIVEIDGVEYAPTRLHHADYGPVDEVVSQYVPEFGRLESVRFVTVSKGRVVDWPTVVEKAPYYRRYT